MSVMYVVTGDSINLTIDGKMEVMHRSHRNYDEVVKLLKSGDYDEETLVGLVNPAEKIREFGEGNLSVRDSSVYYKTGEEEVEVRVDDSLISRIEAMIDEGFNVKPLVLFFDNLMLNPSAHAVTGLYRFLEHNQLPLTDDGHFLAYKKVRYDYTSVHENPDGSRMDNSVGKVVEMMRNQVDDNHDRTCSSGLHFASFKYASDFYSNWDRDDRLMIVKVNPRDVVAFPHDYNNAKGRCCRYEVVSEVPNDGMEYILNDMQGLETVDQVRDTLKKIRDIVLQFVPVEDGKPKFDLKLNDSVADVLHKIKVEAIIEEVKATFDFDAEWPEHETVSIYRLMKWVSREVDLSEVYTSGE